MRLTTLCWIPLLLVGVFMSGANGQTWEWSPAAEHHRAVVQVKSGDRGTSGTLVEYEGLRGVVTVAHGIVGSRATVTFSDGELKTGAVTIDKYKHDLAWIFVDHERIKPLAIAPADLRPGQRVEFVTYGGPKWKLRHFFAQVGRVGERQTNYQTYVVNGDSGGAIVNAVGQLVGVQATGDTPVSAPGAWPVYQGANAASWTPLRSFLSRVAGCGPRGCVVPRRPGVVELYPPMEPTPYHPARPGDPGYVAPPIEIVWDLPKVEPKDTPFPEPVAPAKVEPKGTPGGLAPLWVPGPGAEITIPTPPVDAELEAPAVGQVDSAPSAVGSGIIGQALPAVLTALGWTAPPSAAAMVGLLVLRSWLGRRSRRKGGSPAAVESIFPDCQSPEGIPRDDGEAAELVRLGELNGRSPLHDALVGMFAFDEIDKTIESGGAVADYARTLKRTLEKRFNEVAPVAA